MSDCGHNKWGKWQIDKPTGIEYQRCGKCGIVRTISSAFNYYKDVPSKVIEKAKKIRDGK